MYPRWFSAVACKAKQKENWFPQHPRLYFRMSGLSSRVPHSVKTRIPIAKYFYLLRTSKAFPDWFRKSTCPFPNKKSQIGNKGFSTMAETCRSRPSSSLYFLLFWRVHQLCGPSKRHCCDQGPDDTLKLEAHQAAHKAWFYKVLWTDAGRLWQASYLPVYSFNLCKSIYIMIRIWACSSSENPSSPEPKCIW